MIDRHLAFRFNLTPDATRVFCTTVSDYASFERCYRDLFPHRRPRKLVLRRLFDLFIAISKTRILFCMNHLRAFKDSLPQFQNRPMTYFLNDLETLHAMGVLNIYSSVESLKQSQQTDIAIHKSWGTPAEHIELIKAAYDDEIKKELEKPMPPSWPNV